MKTKLLTNMYDFDCKLFRSVNRHFDHKILNFYFRTITHLGGAITTIAVCLIMFSFTKGLVQATSIASGAALLISHLPVTLVKKLYPRNRPYLTLLEAKVTANPLRDHSFPSGHTTAIFSVIIPFILLMPSLVLFLIPLAISVGLSRMYLGLHYPSDVIVGCILGTSSGFISYFLLSLFPLIPPM